MRSTSPGLTLVLPSLIVAVSRATAPVSISACRRERLMSGRAVARKRSRRPPACSSSTRASRDDPPTEEFCLSDVTPTPANEDYKSSPSYRGARAAVILLGVLLAIAFIMLVVGLIMRMTGHGP